MVSGQKIDSAKNPILPLVVLAVCCLGASATRAPDVVIDAQPHVLGRHTDGDKGDHPQMDLRFRSTLNSSEVTLEIDHREVMLPLFVAVNGRKAGQIGRSYHGSGKSFVPVPAGVLKNGENILSIAGEVFVSRNFTIEKIALFKQPLRELLHLGAVTLTVTDEETGKPVPARVSLVNEQGEGTDIYSMSASNNAVRKGLVYTTGNECSFEIPQGRYEFYATRGMEWSLGRKTISIGAGGTGRVDLRIRRQVDTRGFIAADTHVHTATMSGHGDATVDERIVTLAAEGVELAVATDHNHFTDYRPAQTRLGFNSFFTPVIGDEISLAYAHLNAFPFRPDAELPDNHESDWVRLVSDARLKGARVVILNHPHYPTPQTNALTRFNFNRASGDRFNGPAFTFDAMELVNSSSPDTIRRPEIQANPVQLLADWFAILNHGEKITGVGSSDTHTVDVPTGQGRTYIRSSTDDAAHLDVDELIRNFLAGDTAVSYGIFAEATVDQSRHMGETLRPANRKAEVTLRVAAPDWITPRRAIVFLNGLPVEEKKLQPAPGKPFDQRLKFSIQLPAHDTYLVCAVFGDGVTGPYWPTITDYTSAVTNPFYLDNDGDGQFQFPRETARKMLAAIDGTLDSAWKLLEQSDDALAGQMLGLLYLDRAADFVKQLDKRVHAAAPRRQLYRIFLEHSPLIVRDTKAFEAADKAFEAAEKRRAAWRQEAGIETARASKTTAVARAGGPAARPAAPHPLFTRWEVQELLPGGRFDAVAYLGKDVVIVGSRAPNPGHVFRSEDLGRTWTEIAHVTSDSITCLASGGNGLAYLLTQKSGFFRSEDYGRSWKQRSQIKPDTPSRRVVSYGILVTDRGTVLVSDTTITGGHLHRSTDQGTTWSDRGAYSTAGFYRFDRTGDGVIVNGWAGSVYKSTDDGLTWHEAQNLAHEPLYATERLGPDTNLQASESGHIYLSKTNGESWRDVGALTEASDDFVRLGQRTALLTTYTRGKNLYMSTDGGETWANIGPLRTGADGDWLDHVIGIEQPNGTVMLGGSNKGFVVRAELDPPP